MTKLTPQLTPQVQREYWRYNTRLAAILLGIWFVVSYLMGGLFSSTLNEVSILGFPLGYYVAAQGSVIVFVVEIVVYARLMNAKDLELGIREHED